MNSKDTNRINIEENNKKDLMGRVETFRVKDLTFSPKELIQVSFPHRKPEADKISKKVGKLTVSMGTINADKSISIPYGSYPRIIMFWITCEALKNKKDKQGEDRFEINLGSSLKQFMEKLGVGTDGRTMSSFKQQLKNLLATGVSITFEEDKYDRKSWEINNAWVADDASLWWDDEARNKNGKDDPFSFFQAKIKLSEKFFNFITKSPIPLDMKMIKEIKQSPLSLDIYSLLTYRIYSIKQPVTISWINLMSQLGTFYNMGRKSIHNFKQEVEKALLKLTKNWADLKVQTSTEGLTIYPQAAHIPTKTTRMIAKDINVTSD